MAHKQKYTCPCCGYLTLESPPPDSHGMICEICFWEDDDVQSGDPDHAGGANDVSLREAQRNFEQLGACKERVKQYVRPPTASDRRDPNWRPLPRERIVKRTRTIRLGPGQSRFHPSEQGSP